MTWFKKIILLLGLYWVNLNGTAAQDFDKLMKDDFRCKELKEKRSEDYDPIVDKDFDKISAGEERKFVLGLPEFHTQLSTQLDASMEWIYKQEKDATRVFTCNWSKLAKKVKYEEMAANLEKAAKSFAQRWTVNINGTPTALHLIGMGLGAHFFGLVARIFDMKGHKINRITGLDPVGLCFDAASASKCSGKTYSGLKKTDAKYVDVLFTGREFWGVCDRPEVAGKMDICHACYFANGGYRQPGCAGNGDGANIISACSHNRAAALFEESVMYGRSFNSSGCTTGGIGPCDLMMNTFGYFTDLDSEGIFGFATNAFPPYSIPLICWPEAGSDDGRSSFQDCHISDHNIM